MNSPAPLEAALAAAYVTRTDWGGWLVRCIRAGEKLLDAIAIVVALYAAERIHTAVRPHGAWQSPAGEFFCAAAFAVLFIFLLERHGGYRPWLSLLAIRETERTLRVNLQSFSIALMAAYLLHAPASRLTIAIAVVLVPLFLTLEKWEIHGLLRLLRNQGYGMRRAIIFGTGSTARRLFTALTHSPKLGVEPVAFVDEDAAAATTEIFECGYSRKRSAKVLPGPVTPELCRELGASVLVIAEPVLDRNDLLLTCEELGKSGVETYFATDDFAESGSWLDYIDLDGIMLAHLSRGDRRALYETGKRMMDVLLAGAAILLLFPFALLTAVLVKRTSAGPVLFRQARVGRNGRRFSICKFRTMYEDAPEYGYSPGQVDDPRVTPLGRVLRRTSFDEFPQFINVLLGDMSLVGPRPEMPFIVAQYTPSQRQRLAVKPGLTGLWQISADRAYLIHENLEYDLYYLANNPAFVWQSLLQFSGLRKFKLCARSAETEVTEP